MRWLLTIALLFSIPALAMAASTASERATTGEAIAPASPSETALAEFLKRKYGKGGLFGVIEKVLDSGSNGPSTGPQNLEGPQPDGSYWWLAYFAYQNVREYAGPYNSLKAQCTKAKGTMIQAARYRVLGGPGKLDVTLADPSGGGAFIVSPQMLRTWRSSTPEEAEATARAEPRARWVQGGRADLIDQRQVLGLFSCTRGANTPLWHIAILPTGQGHLGALAEDSSSTVKWQILSIRLVTRNLVQATKAEYDEQLAKASASQKVAIEQSRQLTEQLEAEARKRAPVMEAFRKNLAIGTRTNCGTVLDLRGPLVEVQVPARMITPTGERRVFVQRKYLEPHDDFTQPCTWEY